MGGRYIHFYDTRVKPAWCIFLTGAAPHTCIRKSQWCKVAAGGTWKPGVQDQWFSALRSLQYTWAESTRSTGVRTAYWTQGSYCVVIKMVFQRISVVCRTPEQSV